MNCALAVSSLWQTLLITWTYRREYPKTQRHSVIEHCRMVRAIVRSNLLRTRCGSRRLHEGAGEHSDLPVLCTEWCQYNSLCVCVCKDLCEITKNVQQVRFRTCSSLFLLTAVIFQHNPKNVDAFVPYWHEYKYSYFVSAEISFFQSHPFTNNNCHFLTRASVCQALW